MSRTYTTRRLGIITALVDKLKTINGAGAFFIGCKWKCIPSFEVLG